MPHGQGPQWILRTDLVEFFPRPSPVALVFSDAAAEVMKVVRPECLSVVVQSLIQSGGGGGPVVVLIRCESPVDRGFDKRGEQCYQQGRDKVHATHSV